MKAIDLHCDTITRLDIENKITLRKNELQIDLSKLKESQTVLQNFAIYIDLDETDQPYELCNQYIDLYYQELANNKETIAPVYTFADYERNLAEGLISAMLTMEEGAPLAGRLDRLEEFYDKGVRLLTLTWNYPNEIGQPNLPYMDIQNEQILQEQKGLTAQGIDIVQRMNELGMIIDVSHGSDQLVRDVLNYTKKPFVASHSNARTVHFHSRNLSDELIKKIGDRGGVIGLNYSERFLRKDGSKTSLVDALVAHAIHIKNVGGIECLALGSDFDGIPRNKELDDVRSISKIEAGLEKAGFSQQERELVFSGNVERLYKELL